MSFWRSTRTWRLLVLLFPILPVFTCRSRREDPPHRLIMASEIYEDDSHVEPICTGIIYTENEMISRVQKRPPTKTENNGTTSAKCRLLLSWSAVWQSPCHAVVSPSVKHGYFGLQSEARTYCQSLPCVWHFFHMLLEALHTNNCRLAAKVKPLDR